MCLEGPSLSKQVHSGVALTPDTCTSSWPAFIDVSPQTSPSPVQQHRLLLQASQVPDACDSFHLDLIGGFLRGPSNFRLRYAVLLTSENAYENSFT